MALPARYPAAVWRPLSGRLVEPPITPRILVVHTMVGYLRGSEALFRRDGYHGTESHFGVGGPGDGADLDGAVWQWQATNRQADAQNAGNGYCTSVETSDAGDPLTPWSPAQVEALVELVVWWCRGTGHPARISTATTEPGIGWHAQHRAWAPDGRTCPGPVRIRQLREHVVPDAAAILTADPRPTRPAGAPVTLTRVLAYRPGAPMLRGLDVSAVQRAVGAIPDGWYGPATKAAVVAHQRRLRLSPDGVVGPATAAGLGLGWSA